MISKRTLEGVIVAFLIALTQISTYAYTTSMPAIADTFQVSACMVQYSLSIYLVGYAFTQLFCGPLADYFGRRRVVFAHYVVYIVGVLITFFSVNIYMFWLGLFVQSVATGAFVSLARTLLRDIYGAELIVKVMSIIGTMVALMPTISPVLGGYLQLWFGWRSIYIFFLICAIASWFLIYLFVQKFELPKTIGKGFWGEMVFVYKRSFQHPGFMGYLLCMGFMAGGMIVFFAGFPFFLQQQMGVSPVDYSWMFLLTCVGYILGTLVTHVLHKYCGVYRSTLLGVAISLVGSGAALFLLVSHEMTLILSILLGFIYLLGIGVMLPSSKGGALSQFSTHIGTVTSIMGFFLVFIASVVSALAATFNYSGNEHPACVTFVVAILAFVSLWYLHLRHKKNQA